MTFSPTQEVKGEKNSLKKYCRREGLTVSVVNPSFYVQTCLWYSKEAKK